MGDVVGPDHESEKEAIGRPAEHEGLDAAGRGPALPAIVGHRKSDQAEEGSRSPGHDDLAPQGEGQRGARRARQQEEGKKAGRTDLRFEKAGDAEQGGQVEEQVDDADVDEDAGQQPPPLADRHQLRLQRARPEKRNDARPQEALDAPHRGLGQEIQDDGRREDAGHRSPAQAGGRQNSAQRAAEGRGKPLPADGATALAGSGQGPAAADRPPRADPAGRGAVRRKGLFSRFLKLSHLQCHQT